MAAVPAMTGESQVEEPRTEAGALLLVRREIAAARGTRLTLDLGDVLTIEAEAREQTLAAVEEAVAGLRVHAMGGYECEWDCVYDPDDGKPGCDMNEAEHDDAGLSLSSVLAAITALRQPQEAKDTRGEDR